MNNTNNKIENKVVYINEEDEAINNTSENDSQEKQDDSYVNKYVSIEDTIVNSDVYENNVEEGTYKENDTYNDNDNDEFEDYTSNTDDILLNLRQQSGYESDGGDISDNDSIATIDILRVDPLYLRLTKFLETDDGESVANTLKKINEQLITLNTNLSKNH
jgi:hypothetical protein